MDIENTHPPLMLSFKPSVFYYRKALRESPSREAAVKMAVTVATEFERLRDWSIQQGVMPASNIHVAADLLRAAIRQSGSHGQVILLGLFVCQELEDLKAIVRDCGMIPPKWVIAPEEAQDKGWKEDDAVNQ